MKSFQSNTENEPEAVASESDDHSFDSGLRLLAKLIAAKIKSAADAKTALLSAATNNV